MLCTKLLFDLTYIYRMFHDFRALLQEVIS